MANHLTPSELADQMQMKRQDVSGSASRWASRSFTVASTGPCSRPPCAAGDRRLEPRRASRAEAELDFPGNGAGNQVQDARRSAAARGPAYGDTPAVRFKQDGKLGRSQLFGGDGDRPPAGTRPDRAGGREGRSRLDPRQHPARVDLLRLRRALGRRHGRPDLPDQLAGGVPLRARELRRQGRRRRGRRTAGEDPRGPR